MKVIKSESDYDKQYNTGHVDVRIEVENVEDFKELVYKCRQSIPLMNKELEYLAVCIWNALSEMQMLIPEEYFPEQKDKFNIIDESNGLSIKHSGEYLPKYYTIKGMGASSLEIRENVIEVVYSYNKHEMKDKIPFVSERLYFLSKNIESVLNFARGIYSEYEKSVEERKKFFTDVKSIKSADIYFEELYHNTGRTLGEVVKLMKDEGYIAKDVMFAISKVLNDIQWED